MAAMGDNGGRALVPRAQDPRPGPDLGADATYYEILGVKRDATTDEIAEAYRRHAKRLHPDASGGNRESFERLVMAYRTLSNEQDRAWYDQHGSDRKVRFDEMPAIAELIGNAFSAVFDSAVRDHNVQSLDITREIKRWLQAVKRANVDLNNADKGRLRKLEKLLKRYRYKGKRVDVIGNHLREQIKVLKASIAEEELKIAYFDLAVAYADDLIFEGAESASGPWAGVRTTQTGVFFR